jgi:hypothetical protein
MAINEMKRDIEVEGSGRLEAATLISSSSLHGTILPLPPPSKKILRII